MRSVVRYVLLCFVVGMRVKAGHGLAFPLRHASHIAHYPSLPKHYGPSTTIGSIHC